MSILVIFGLIIFTGVLGVALAKFEGLETLKRMQKQIEKGIPPGDELLNGVSILLGGALLFLPGFITDICGILLLVPFTRKLFNNLLKYRLMKRFSRKEIVYKKW